MRYAIRTPLLHILHTLPSLLVHRGVCFSDFHLVYFESLRERGQRLREEISGCRELFAEGGGLTPVFEGSDGGEEDEDALGGCFQYCVFT